MEREELLLGAAALERPRTDREISRSAVLWRHDSLRIRRERSHERFTSRNETTNHNVYVLRPVRAMSTGAGVWVGHSCTTDFSRSFVAADERECCGRFS